MTPPPCFVADPEKIARVELKWLDASLSELAEMIAAAERLRDARVRLRDGASNNVEHMKRAHDRRIDHLVAIIDQLHWTLGALQSARGESVAVRRASKKKKR